MTKLIRLTLGVIFLTTSGYGQAITRAEIVKFRIKSMTTLDSDGRIKSIDYYNDLGDLVKIGNEENGSLQILKEFTYDQEKRLILERRFTSDGEIYGIEKYAYNSKSQLVTKESYDSNNNVDATWTYEYNENGNMVGETRRSGTLGNSVTLFKYINGKLAEKETSNDAIGKENKITYRYNDKGRLVEQRTEDYFSHTTITSTYSYSNAGKLVELEEKSSNGVSSLTSYQYDEKGLLESDIWESSLAPISQKTTYKMEY